MRSSSWRRAIEVQRRELARRLEDNPSLKSRLGEAIETAYGDAGRETGVDKAQCPAVCPRHYEDISERKRHASPIARRCRS